MKFLIISAMLLPALAGAELSATAKTALKTKSSHAFMLGDRLVVTGSSLGLSSEKEARIFAAKDAAQVAAEFIDKQGLGKSMEIKQGVENAVLLETPLASEEKGAIKIEDLRQERWSNEAGVDRYSIHLVISIRVGKKHKAVK